MLIQKHAHTHVEVHNRWSTLPVHHSSWSCYVLLTGLSFSLLMSVTVIMSRVCKHTEVTYMQDIRKTHTIQCLFSIELWVRWVMGRPTQNLCRQDFAKSSTGFCRIWLLVIQSFSHLSISYANLINDISYQLKPSTFSFLLKRTYYAFLKLFKTFFSV